MGLVQTESRLVNAFKMRGFSKMAGSEFYRSKNK